MKLGKIAVAAAAMSLVAAPIAAQADISRLAAPVSEASENGGNAGAILAIAAVLAIAIGVAAGDSSPTPTSPQAATQKF